MTENNSNGRKRIISNNLTRFLILFVIILIAPTIVVNTGISFNIDPRYIVIGLLVLVLIYIGYVYIKIKLKYMLFLSIIVVLSIVFTATSLIKYPDKYITPTCPKQLDLSKEYFGQIVELKQDVNEKSITVDNVLKLADSTCKIESDIHLVFTGDDIKVSDYYVKNGGIEPTVDTIGYHLMEGAFISFSLNQWNKSEHVYDVNQLSLIKPSDQYKK